MLFSRRKATTTSVEGTHGKYVKRESPPTVPSLAATAVSHTRRSPIAASTLMLSSVPPAPSTPPPEFELFHLEHTVEAQVDEFEHTEDSFDVNDLKEMDFERLHSRSTASENDVYTEPSEEPSTSFGARNNNVLSSRSFNRGALRYVPRKSLTASHSIGNVEQGMRELSVGEKGLVSPQPPRFQSLQTLPSEHLMTIQQYRNSCESSDGSSDLPLPENWAIEYTTENQRYYVDHSNRRTHWVHPLVHESLKPGWKKIYDPQKGVFYYNEEMKRTQYEHPGISNPIFRTESVNVASRSTVDLNANLHIIEEKELPPWLLMYAQSDSSLDHLLEWDLFNYEQLTEYEHLMMKLYKQEVFDIVKKYERKRNILNREIHRRDVSRPPPARK
uniref:Protein salvador homolog 1 n=1 Tax=Caenorhabditis japonica TaxID=281687 RepID=A0A8R1I4K9_CAEJA